MEEKEISYPLLEKLYSGINKMGDAVNNLNKKIEAIAGHIPELTATLLYVVLHIVISYFHEPWYDEAIAWQIAKCASVKDIFFTLLHYEGHPPLWYLILMPFARLGCPYEFSLMLVSLIFSGLAVGLIIWKSPFPRLVRLLMPFTYFFFYQYSVISRPYCIMMLAFVLAAITFKDKDTKPWRFIFSLMLLCLSSAYGIVFAGGITIAWLIGLLKKEGFLFLLDKRRTASLLCLLILAVLLILEIIPENDAFAIMSRKFLPVPNGILQCLLYTFFALPADVCITTVFSSDNNLAFACLDIQLISGVIFGILIIAAIIYVAYKKRTLLLFLIPYGLFSIFTAIKYLALHHIGVELLFFVFWAWCSIEVKDNVRTISNKSVEKNIISAMRLAGILPMTISLWWNISASIHEISDVYGIGRNEAKFILEHDLDDYNIMIGYYIYYKFDENDVLKDEVWECDFNHCNVPDSILAYMDRNIFFNLNDGRDDMAFTFNKHAGLEECTGLIEKWRAQGAPDVLVNPTIDISAVYSGITDIGDYTRVYFRELNQIWKATDRPFTSEIYVRTDLVEELGLEKLTVSE
ncbi:MAG: hypothetical protein ACI4I1_08830 [Oscillospiraceae bacterium]